MTLLCSSEEIQCLVIETCFMREGKDKIWRDLAAAASGKHPRSEIKFKSTSAFHSSLAAATSGTWEMHTPKKDICHN